VPAEARTVEEALRLADQRMYEHKAGGSSANRQSTDVLLQVLSERSAELHDHLGDVAELAQLTAQALGLPAHEVARIGLAAELRRCSGTQFHPAVAAAFCALTEARETAAAQPA
jgi:HD-GYP domain-containing protein (c-di-GMP phosphodiesterase class II)